MAACIEDEARRLEVEFSRMEFTLRPTGDGIIMDGEATLESMDPPNYRMEAEDVFFTMNDFDRNVVDERIPLEPAGSDVSEGIHIILVDLNGSDGRVQVGDKIRIVGLTRTMLGASFDMNLELANPEINGFIYFGGLLGETSIESVEWRESGADLYFDVNITFDKTRIVDGELNWASFDLTIELQDRVTESRYEIQPYTGIKGTTTQAWYHDFIGDASSMDIGDQIIVTGLNVSHMNGWVYISHEALWTIGLVNLPSEFRL
jgi:hypothetical protein